MRCSDIDLVALTEALGHHANNEVLLLRDVLKRNCEREKHKAKLRAHSFLAILNPDVGDCARTISKQKTRPDH